MFIYTFLHFRYTCGLYRGYYIYVIKVGIKTPRNKLTLLNVYYCVDSSSKIIPIKFWVIWWTFTLIVKYPFVYYIYTDPYMCIEYNTEHDTVV